jgi:dTDP-4-dehydrorhamnose reductase
VRVLVLGGGGMLGHQACRRLGGRFDVWATYRSEPRTWMGYGSLVADRALGGVDAAAPDTVWSAIAEVRPDVVVNCIGIVKQRDEAKMAVPSITVNSLFPHLLADQCASAGARLFHITTDCVFSGRKGAYTEEDVPDPVDLYGRSKLLGEVERAGVVTLRTSIIGWEVKGRASLLEWFAAQRGRTISGYARAIYSGLSTAALADVIGWLIEEHAELEGLFQVASEPIDKLTLLAGMRDALGWDDITIVADDAFACDRSLDATRFGEATGFRAPSWPSMIDGLAAEWPEYAAWRGAK